MLLSIVYYITYEVANAILLYIEFYYKSLKINLFQRVVLIVSILYYIISPFSKKLNRVFMTIILYSIVINLTIPFIVKKLFLTETLILVELKAF